MAENIKVLTLNCWGVHTPLCCQFRHERIAFIGQDILKADYDIVILEELWSPYDYEKIADKLKSIFPHSHLFYSGLIGTGVAVFSRTPIKETLLHKFALNGYPHKFYHGDWFGGKGVGLAKINVKGFNINVYGTHLHAQYDEATDEYPAHRAAQAYEVGQFIKLTSTNADAVILGGDLNLQPKDLGYKLIISNAQLYDAWTSQEAEPSDAIGSTCDRPDNLFHCKHTLSYAPDGLRLDYLLYKAGQGCAMKCIECNLCFGKIEGQAYPYSDHEGVEAVFKLSRNEEVAMSKDQSSKDFELSYMEALTVMEEGLRRVNAHRVYAVVASLICLVALVYTAGIDLPLGLNYVIAVSRFLITLIAGYLLWFAIVFSTQESNGILATKHDINNLLKAK